MHITHVHHRFKTYVLLGCSAEASNAFLWSVTASPLVQAISAALRWSQRCRELITTFYMVTGYLVVTGLHLVFFHHRMLPAFLFFFSFISSHAPATAASLFHLA